MPAQTSVGTRLRGCRDDLHPSGLRSSSLSKNRLQSHADQLSNRIPIPNQGCTRSEVASNRVNGSRLHLTSQDFLSSIEVI